LSLTNKPEESTLYRVRVSR